jgi:SAM-dependent methyltransferase
LQPSSVLKRLILVTRKRLPGSIRRALRLARHLFFKGHSSPLIPADLLSDCRMSASRAELIGLLPCGGRIAEVGTDRGHFARLILDTCDPAELHLIDLDLSLLDRAVAKDHRVALHGGMSHLVLEGFPEAYFDWIYIDGDHSYAGVTRDADAAASRVKPGGFLVFNDFAHIDPFQAPTVCIAPQCNSL